MTRRGGPLPDRELSAWMDGELPSARAREVEERVAGDPRRRARLERFVQVSRALAVRCDPDPAFVARHRARRAAVSVIPRWTWRQCTARLAAATAACLLAAGLAVLRGSAPDAAAPPPVTADAAPIPAGFPGPMTLAALESELLAPWGADPSGSFPDERASGDPEPVLLIAVGAAIPLPADPAR